MKTQKFLMIVILAGTTMTACEKDPDMMSGSSFSNTAARLPNNSDPIDQKVEDRNPKKMVVDGEINYFEYNADNQLQTITKNDQRIFLKYDRSGRVEQMSRTRNDIPAYRTNSLQALNERTVFKYIGASMWPVKATVYQTLPGNNETAIQQVDYNFSVKGKKTSDKIESLSTNVITTTDYVYDQLGRLTGQYTTRNGELLKSITYEEYEIGHSEWTTLNRMALVPGEGVQIGNPILTKTDSRTEHHVRKSGYELNELHQPVFIRSLDNDGTTHEARIDY